MIENRLKQLRKENSLTQKELADKLNISKGSIAMYETGKRSPDNDILSSIADFFDVSTDYLLGRSNIRRYSEEILAFNTTEHLTDADLKLVKDLIETLKSKNLQKK
ncbi:helix-turn-helix domain-containing protein [Fusibacter sp. 3D3]|uniref:helix-turn-helix domain-containing protein n=1 Tax=Fusibacter sp. 3D3 TaxID=1048380 RepID=UPI0008530206|nr:helix-turn-helix transcriptional regulator [Fusibacter sp. 3D3]